MATAKSYYCSGLCNDTGHFTFTAEELENYVLPNQRGIRWPAEIPCPSCHKPCFCENTKEGKKLRALWGNFHDQATQQTCLNLRTPRLDTILIGQGKWEERRAWLRRLGLTWKNQIAEKEVRVAQLIAESEARHEEVMRKIEAGAFPPPWLSAERIYLLSHGRAVDVTARFGRVTA